MLMQCNARLQFKDGGFATGSKQEIKTTEHSATKIKHACGGSDRRRFIEDRAETLLVEAEPPAVLFGE
jgi:hypothetical protein